VTRLASLWRRVTRTQDWQATHRYHKGALYRLIGPAVLETDRSNVVIYDDADGAVWVRPVEEFNDGRFSPL
jgi:hypothetical protein